jgi:hypothetical protein
MRRKQFILFVFLFIILWAGQAGCQEIFDLKALNADIEISGHPDRFLFGRKLAVGDINGDGIDDIAAVSSGCGYDYHINIIYGRPDFSGSIDLGITPPDVKIIGDWSNSKYYLYNK